MSEVPDMLTVEEAARILRVGRTTGYELANRWLDSGGAEGLPVIHVGRLLRVPTVLFEERFSLRVTSRTGGLIGTNRRQPTAPTVCTEETIKPTAKPIQRQSRRGRGDQTALPFAG
ncbi:MAG: hypothetical protein QOH36_2346 [Actinomycetota bacterium]|jgi:hypothetical protein|nr:hypothetical protein [Actinomycetota bacterium]